MSTLSETLERHLRELRNPKPKPTMAAPKPAPIEHEESMTRQHPYEESVRLAYTGGTSDKVYHIMIQETPPLSGMFTVDFKYGRRTGRLQCGTKTPRPVPLLSAMRIFKELRQEKIAKGYRVVT
jgi:hypothetical protein